jgi:hypothetical protein
MKNFYLDRAARKRVELTNQHRKEAARLCGRYIEVWDELTTELAEAYMEKLKAGIKKMEWFDICVPCQRVGRGNDVRYTTH